MIYGKASYGIKKPLEKLRKNKSKSKKRKKSKKIL